MSTACASTRLDATQFSPTIRAQYGLKASGHTCKLWSFEVSLSTRQLLFSYSPLCIRVHFCQLCQNSICSSRSASFTLGLGQRRPLATFSITLVLPLTAS